MDNVKTVWITGASSGIGAALAHTYNSKGYFTILSARREDVLESVRANLPHSENAAVLALDLGNYQDAQQWFSQAISYTGQIDILINNGGMGHLGSVMDMQPAVESKVMDVNFWGAVSLTKVVLPHMIARGSGAIWTVASILGFFGSPKLAAYAASKSAVLGYFESLWFEMKDTPIHIGVVSPGFINTNVTLSSLDAQGKPLGKNSVAQEKGMLPEVFAKKFYAKSQRRRRHMLIGGYELASVYLKRYCPWFFAILYAKMTAKARK